LPKARVTLEMEIEEFDRPWNWDWTEFLGIPTECIDGEILEE